MRGLQDAARFDPAQYGQKLWRLDVADRAVAQPRKKEWWAPLTIELARKMPIFIGYMPIRISQLLPKLPQLLQILCK